jgi:N-methylhydantoinase A
VLIGGGGAAGLNGVAIARRLGCRRVVVPAVGAALSAAGALMSDLGTEFARMAFTTARRFDAARVNDVLEGFARRCRDFVEGPGREAGEPMIALSVEARYPHQIWEIDVPLRITRFDGPGDLDRLVEDFHAQHRAIFAIDDPGSDVEFVTWRARVRCRLARGDGRAALRLPAGRPEHRRRAYFPLIGWTDARVLSFESLAMDGAVPGPALIESPFTTVVVDPGASARRAPSGGLVIDLERQPEHAP